MKKESWEDKKEGSKGSWFFFPRTLALYNLFIFSAQEDHAKPEWNLKNNLLLEPVIPKWKLCVLTLGALLLSLIVWTANCPQKKTIRWHVSFGDVKPHPSGVLLDRRLPDKSYSKSMALLNRIPGLHTSICLRGSAPVGHVQVWVTGRWFILDPEELEQDK